MPQVLAEPIFISYRRSDTGAHAKRLHDRLVDWFGPGTAFLDQGSIDAGAVFPKRLERALNGARAVLVLLGPGWLDALKVRAAEPAEVDYVRVEVEQALQRQADGSLRLLLPLLVGGAQMSMLGAAKLPLATWPAIAPLAKVNGMALRSGEVEWEQDFSALRILLADAAGLKPAPRESAEARLERVAKSVRKLLARDALAPLRVEWGADPVGADAENDVYKLIGGFGRALKAAREALQTAPARGADIRKDCRGLLAQLYQLAVDAAAAREWGQTVASARPVPAQAAGTVAMVHAVASGADVRIAGQPEPNRFIAERSADLGHVDAGIGEDRRAFAHTELWRLLYPQRDYPGSAKTALTGSNLQDMQYLLQAEKELGDGYILSGVVGASKGAVADFVALGAELHVAALGRTGAAGELLRVDEGKLNALVYAILLEIEKIP